jgi:hypothetical protein
MLLLKHIVANFCPKVCFLNTSCEFLLCMTLQKVLAFSGDLEANSPAKLAKKSVAGGAKAAQPHKKVSVGINPWKLARLNAEVAAKVAAQAREGSTNVIRPITRDSKGSSQVTETEADSSLESSRNVSGEITVLVGNKWTHQRRKPHDLAYLTGKERWLLMKDRRGKSNITVTSTATRPGTLLNGSPQSIVLPLPLEARNGFRFSPSRFSGEMRASYPGSSYPGRQLASPEMTFQESPELQAILPPSPSTLVIQKPAAPVVEEVPGSTVNGQLQRSYSTDGYEASTGESGDETTTGNLVQTLNKSNLDTSVVTPNEKVAVWEDGSCQESIVKPRTSSGSRSLGSRGSRSSRAESTGGGLIHNHHYLFLSLHFLGPPHGVVLMKNVSSGNIFVIIHISNGDILQGKVPSTACVPKLLLTIVMTGWIGRRAYRILQLGVQSRSQYSQAHQKREARARRQALCIS